LIRSSKRNAARTLAGSVLLLLIAAMPRTGWANGADLPPQIVVQGFVKQENDRIRLVVRVPLVLLSTFGFPKRGPGYLDLANIDDKLQVAASATGQQIKLALGGMPLVPADAKGRLSRLSDRSFRQYETALAHFDEPPLPLDTDLFWNQGFFDARFEYPAPAASGTLAVRIDIAPELGNRLKVRLQYLPVGDEARTYEISGAAGWISLDPKWHEAAWLFMKAGFVQPFTIDRFVFLACLVAPFRRLRSLLAFVVMFAATQATTLTAVARGTVESSLWLPAVVASALAAASIGLAVGNLAAPSLRRRWFIGAVIGSLGGFGLGHVLAELLQFAGGHPLPSLISFNTGLALGEIAALLIVFIALRLLFRSVLGPMLGVVVLSAVLGHVAWHWMTDGNQALAHDLGHAVSEGWAPAAPILWWMLPAVIVGALGLLLPRAFGGARVTSLRDAMLGRATGDDRAR